MEFKLKNGQTTEDVRLGRIPFYDERSRNYAIREAVGDRKPRSYTWRCSKVLDQKNYGACVGFAWAHELIARPSEITHIDHEAAMNLYFLAQMRDPWPGGEYPDSSPIVGGTSVLAGAKAAQAMGYIDGYKWGFGLEDAILGIGYEGPAVIGVHWREGMQNPDSNGFIHPTGSYRGGHALLAYGENVRTRTVYLHNSWSEDWGDNGTCKVSFDDFEKMLMDQGEICFPVGRKRVAA